VSYRWSACVTHKSLKGWLNNDFSVFWNKIQFQSNSLLQFRSVITSISKVVEQSIKYEITEKHRTKNVYFHVKYWLKLTYPIVASMCMLIMMVHTTDESHHV